jgi:hypothetical protein
MYKKNKKFIEGTIILAIIAVLVMFYFSQMHGSINWNPDKKDILNHVGYFVPGEYDYSKIDNDYALIFIMKDETQHNVDSIYTYDNIHYITHIMNDPPEKITSFLNKDIYKIYYMKAQQ